MARLFYLFTGGAGGHSVILELRALQRTLLEIKELGGQLIAVSPHLPDNSLSIARKLAIEFEVLSDVGNQVARDFGLVSTKEKNIGSHLNILSFILL